VSAHQTFEAFRRSAHAGHLAPVVREFSADTLTPVAAFAAIHRPPFGFLLESLVGGERWARYSFLGTDTNEAWRYRDRRAARWDHEHGWRDDGEAPDPLAHLGSLVRRRSGHPLSGLPRFAGGAVGYIGYDVVRTLETLPGGPEDDLGLPDAIFLLADTVVIFDNAFGRASIVAHTEGDPADTDAALRRVYGNAVDRVDALLERLSRAASLRPLALHTGEPAAGTCAYLRPDFERDVDVIRGHIRAGDVFQAVLSRRQDLRCTAPPFQVYRALRALNPAPYLYYLALDDLTIAGSSPEVLVRVEDGNVTVRPIAGTRRRGATVEEDDELARTLLADPKELAEHAMLVDLGRNDIGRTAAFGSVRVTADKVIERYSHVQHIVSEVRARLKPGSDAFDALRACFPAGTVTGAPKVRAMQLLDSLEPTRRGPYAGAVGYIGSGGHTLDTAIAIRTAILRGDRAYVQAGAGIVADSDPTREFLETEEKARAVLAAIALAEASSPPAADGGIFFR